MKTKIFAAALVAATAAAITGIVPLDAKPNGRIAEPEPPVSALPIDQLIDQPVVDAVFVLDTTGSMSGLIQTAKEKRKGRKFGLGPTGIDFSLRSLYAGIGK